MCLESICHQIPHRPHHEHRVLHLTIVCVCAHAHAVGCIIPGEAPQAASQKPSSLFSTTSNTAIINGEDAKNKNKKSQAGKKPKNGSAVENTNSAGMSRGGCSEVLVGGKVVSERPGGQGGAGFMRKRTAEEVRSCACVRA